MAAGCVWWVAAGEVDNTGNQLMHSECCRRWSLARGPYKRGPYKRGPYKRGTTGLGYNYHCYVELHKEAVIIVVIV